MKNFCNKRYSGISISDKHFERTICKRFELDEKNKLLNDLKTLNTWCQNNKNDLLNPNKLYTYFEDEFIGAYCRYVTAKKKAWSPLKNLCADLGTSLIPVTSGLCLFLFSKDTEWSVGTVGLVAGIILAVFWVLSLCFQAAQKRRAYRETWVRHSTCYGRLRLALCRFLASNQNNINFVEFADDVFSILEQNYNKFSMNLSNNGSIS